MYSTVLMKVGRVKDLPGVKHHLIRNKFDLNKNFEPLKFITKKSILSSIPAKLINIQVLNEDF